MIRQGVTAHRGESGAHAENTLGAFRAAMALGAEWIETDVRRSLDGRLLLSHDATTGRRCGADLALADTPFEALRKLDAASAFRRQRNLDEARCPFQAIPTLEEAFALLSTTTGTRLSLHPKAAPVEAILDAARKAGVLHRIGINDGNIETLRAARRIHPTLPLFWDLGPGEPQISWIQVALTEGIHSLVLHESSITEAWVKAVRQAGLEPGAWTVNDPRRMRQLLDLGVSRFYTDDPAALIRLNRSRSLAHFRAEPEIVGHRGCSHEAPENTLPSVKLAWEQGADAVEIDVYLTKDRCVVALHDHTIKRYTGIDKAPGELTLAEMKKMDFGKWKADRWAGTPAASFEEILATVPPGKRLVTEIKSGPEIVPVLAECVGRWNGPIDRLMFIGFSFEVMKKTKELLPAHEAYWLIDFQPANGQWAPDYHAVIAEARAAGFDGLDVGTRGPYDEAFSEAIEESGHGLMVWTVNDAETADRFIRLGAHGLTTDKPGWLRAQLP